MTTMNEALKLAEEWKGRGDDCGRLARAILVMSETLTSTGELRAYLQRMMKSLEEVDMTGFALDCKRLIGMVDAQASHEPTSAGLTIAPSRDGTPLTYARMRAASWFKDDVRVVEADFAAELEVSLAAALREVDDYKALTPSSELPPAEELNRLRLWEQLAHDCIAAVREAYAPGEVGDTDAPKAIRRLIAHLNSARSATLRGKP